jgi:hypothetical protein
MPAPATAGASSHTGGWPVPAVAAAPAPSTTTLAISHGTSSDGVVSSARARPGERSSRPAARSSHPGSRRHTKAAIPVHARPRSTSGGPRAALHRAGRYPRQLRHLRDRPVLDLHQLPDLTFRTALRAEHRHRLGDLRLGQHRLDPVTRVGSARRGHRRLG